MIEEWRPVPGHKRYAVSNHGRLWSFKSKKLMSPSPGKPGYRTVRIDRKTYNVHVLVAAVFIGPRPPGMSVCHWDGDKLNNHVSNLRYDTQAGNAADAIRHGAIPAGERHHACKISSADVEKIREMVLAGASNSSIARDFGISPQTVCDIKKGRRRRRT